MNCKTCKDTGTVCEGHGDRPWEGVYKGGCDCGPGMPCPDCNQFFGTKDTEDNQGN